MRLSIRTARGCRRVLAGLVVLIVAFTADARAQSPSRGFVNINLGVQGAGSDFTDTLTFPSNAEEATVSTDYPAGIGPLFDVSGGVFISANVGVGIGVSRFTADENAAVTAQLPHPFFFDRPRAVSGTADHTRTDTAVHIQALWRMPVTSQVDVAVFGGPTFFSVDQELVHGLTFTDAFPFETATFGTATTQPQSESAVGFHVGADVAIFFTPHVGVGGLIRFSRGTVDFTSADGGVLSVDAGGLQVGGGLRLRF